MAKRPARAAKRKSARKAAARKAPAKKKAAAARKSRKRKTPARKAPGRKAPARKAAKRKTAARKATRPRRTAAAAGPAARSGGLGRELRLRLEIEELHAAYAYCLDHGSIDDWPDFFTEDCVYKLISRENHDLGLPLGTMFAEKRGGLIDRVVSVKQTSVYHERYMIHLIGGTRVLGEKGGVIEAVSNYVLLETLPNQYTRILNAGRYQDRIVRVGGALKFREKLCIYDSTLVPASIIYPV
jgi:3-phenylpropionate/cinnamic acid dioxygenase small subunit